MTYSLPMRQSDGIRTRWWDNFTRTTRVEKYGQGLNFPQDEWITHRDSQLKQYNADYDGVEVHFATEQDAMMFLLRWS